MGSSSASAREFAVSGDVFEQFPDYVVGWVAARFDPATVDSSAVTETLRSAEERVRSVFASTDVKDHPAIAVWRSAFSTAGWSASKYPSSVEALIKRVARGGSLPSINQAVDLVNAVSLTYVVPVGCHGLDQSSHMEVRVARPGDEFLPMGDAPAEPPDEGEIVYANGSQIRTRRWVWRQSRSALVSEASRWIFIPVDGFAETTESSVEAAVAYLSTALSTHFGAVVSTGTVERGRPSATIPALEIGE